MLDVYILEHNTVGSFPMLTFTTHILNAHIKPTEVLQLNNHLHFGPLFCNHSERRRKIIIAFTTNRWIICIEVYTVVLLLVQEQSSAATLVRHPP